jgi:hypothetical protein
MVKDNKKLFAEQNNLSPNRSQLGCCQGNELAQQKI